MELWQKKKHIEIEVLQSVGKYVNSIMVKLCQKHFNFLPKELLEMNEEQLRNMVIYWICHHCDLDMDLTKLKQLKDTTKFEFEKDTIKFVNPGLKKRRKKQK